jgi:hypothetical protein
VQEVPAERLIGVGVRDRVQHPVQPVDVLDTRSASEARWSLLVTSSSRTGGGEGSRRAILSTRLSRPKP